jgi:carboxyl-terminal processing protease
MRPRSSSSSVGLLLAGLIAGILISLAIVDVRAQKDAEPLPVDELRAFANVFNAIKRGYVEPVSDKKLITHAISGMLSNLDPHSAYLDADSYKDLQVSTQGEFGGLGIEVGMEDGLVKVVAPIEDTPAWRAGVKAGDLVYKLDDTVVRGMTLSDAVKRMRGKPGTSIRLGILRKGTSAPLELVIVRDKIRVQSVKAKLLDNQYAYLRITQFQDETVRDVTKQLTRLVHEAQTKSKQPIPGLVLDLRNDPGGLLNSAIGVAAAFLPENAPVVSTDGRTEDAQRKFSATPADYVRAGADPLAGLPPLFKSLHMVVLVNGGSASASEIVAGALQDNKRAVILGTQTFGKGSVQTVIPLPGDTAIKLTTARYYTPSGRSIQAKGITPDVTVGESPNGDSRPGLREADLERHLDDLVPEPAAESKPTPGKTPEDKGRGAKKTSPGETGKASKPDASPPPAAPSAPVEYGSAQDYQLQQALNLLKALGIVVR